MEPTEGKQPEGADTPQKSPQPRARKISPGLLVLAAAILAAVGILIWQSLGPRTAPPSAVAPEPSEEAQPQSQPQPRLHTRTLPNGLEVIVYEDRTAPVVAVNVWYRVGSRNEVPGKRGLAHLMEHMMFKGSKNVGPEEHARLIDRVGGINNAFTREDATGYYDVVPTEALELALRLEAERMQNLVLTQEHLDSEREVVKEEYRLRLENNPVSQAFDRFRALAFEGTPYAWTAAGTPEDLDTITLEDLERFYRRYYVPNNAVLILAGDVVPERAFELAERYFGPIPRGPEPPEVVIEPPEPTARREETLTMPVQLPAVLGGYPLPGAGHDDLPALEIAGMILTAGESSRLNKSLVREQKLAIAAGGVPLIYKDLGMMLVFAFFTPDKDPVAVKEALLREIDRLKEEPLEERELQKAKNQLTAQYVFNLDSISGVGSAIGEAAVIGGDAKLFLEGAKRYADVTPEDVQRVARQYLVDETLTLVTLQPGEEGEGEEETLP